jgi:hypothetical protein
MSWVVLRSCSEAGCLPGSANAGSGSLIVFFALGRVPCACSFPPSDSWILAPVFYLSLRPLTSLLF